MTSERQLVVPLSDDEASDEFLRAMADKRARQVVQSKQIGEAQRTGKRLREPFPVKVPKSSYRW